MVRFDNETRVNHLNAGPFRDVEKIQQKISM